MSSSRILLVLRWLRPLAYAGLLMALLARLGSRVLLTSDAVTSWDARVVDRATTWSGGHPGLVDALLVWQAVTEPWVLQGVVLVTAATLWTRGWRRQRSAWVALTSLATWLLAFLAKLAVDRPRPSPPHPVETLGGLSFPSGHATNAAAAATLLLILLWPLVTSAAARAGLVAGAVLLVAGTMLDRVLLGAHYPTDVLAGLVLGTGMVAVSWAGRVRTAGRLG